ncbi:MAG: GTP pyrophosphokinase [Alphaproteobacteria bacterium]|tara:strand:+ start:79 stop:507 length:429 start_codon:yes stop_codon:yes gene_type:complete
MDLQRALEIAIEAHKGSKDKGGNNYILHPLRVMLSMNTYDEMIVAVLHDVIEDTRWSFEDLEKEGFSNKIILGLKSVTKKSDKEKYENFIQRAKRNDLGRKVKISDIRDNLDVSRLKLITEKDKNRLKKYEGALKILNNENL